MKTVLIIVPDSATRRMFEEAGWFLFRKGGPTPDLICFTGGADINPALYGEDPHPTTYCDPNRDKEDILAYRTFSDIPKVGICRGGQFLNVMNGGKLVQDMPGHRNCLHDVTVNSRCIWPVNSDHHQQMIPSDLSQVLGRITTTNEPEIIWYPKTQSLCFQPHPEWGHRKTRDLFFSLLSQYLGFEELVHATNID
jgi:GMP synthase-like glutamine amidotransferase